MIVVDHVIRDVREEDLRGRELDTLVLTSEQRRWVRGRFTTARGREIAFALPTGTVLHSGALVWIEPDWYLKVSAAPESVLVIVPANYAEAVKISFEVGNLHFPLAMDGDALLVPDDSAMVQLLERLRVRWEHRRAVFAPIGQAHRHEH